MTVLLVDNALALKSMRNSSFDALSAYGEVIDNSLQAGAKNIDIYLEFTPKSGRQFEPIKKIAFADDGHGMNINTLHRCLQLGFSTRYNDRAGIGRFGVGMTLGAINQCKRIEVYSRTKEEADWNYVYIDLDEIEKTAGTDTAAGISPPKLEVPPPEFSKYLPNKSGTLVIWSKYDNQQDSASQLIKEIQKYLGRTYRKFIWNGVTLRINEEKVYAIDPLYVTTKLTKFPDDPCGKEFNEMVIDWPIPIEDRKEGGKVESQITIKMSLLPEKFRMGQGAGNTTEVKDRFINENQGISILRNNREVFYGHIPYWPGDPFAEIDRWWGCEISFNAELDKVFAVKNIKRGAEPVRNLKETICSLITPTRTGCIEQVRSLWAQRKAAQITETNTTNVDSGHSSAEKIVINTPTTKSLIDQDKELEIEVSNLIKNSIQNATDQEKSAWATKFKSQPFTILDKSWRGLIFFEPHFLGGKAVIEYNMQHDFFQLLSEIRAEIDNSSNIEYNAQRIKTLIDLLIIAYSKAEASFDKDVSMSPAEFIEHLRVNWGNFLSSYVRTWKKE